MESHEIIDNNYLILERKGKGATADVFLVKRPETDTIYAGKVLKKSSDLFDKEIEILNILRPLNNQYIINLIQSGTGPVVRVNKPTKTQQYLILEYAQKGELFNYIFCAKKGLEEKYSKLIFFKILRGIQACHNAGICHRDLKMQNILLDQNFNPKICDFGFATINAGNLNESLGTINYAAPEILSHKPYDGFKADIFSLGVILINLVTFKVGFQEATKRDELYRLIMTKLYTQYWKIVGKLIGKVSESFKKLYQKMISYRPQERPSIEDIFNSEWMSEISNLNNDQLNQLENEVRIELLSREPLINEELRRQMESNSQESSDLSDNRGVGDEENTYFDLSLKPKLAQTGIGMNNYIKINGDLSPVRFMNTFANKITKNYENCTIDPKQNALKFNVIFEEEEKEEEEIPKEIEEALSKLGIEDNEDEEDSLRKKDCIIQVKMYESMNGGHLLRFMKKEGELEDYYKYLEKLNSLVKNIL